MPFGFHAPKYFKISWLSNRLELSVPDEDYPRNVHNVFILLFFYVIIWLRKIYTVVITVWLTTKKYPYLKLQRLFSILHRYLSFLYHRQDFLPNLTVYMSTTVGVLYLLMNQIFLLMIITNMNKARLTSLLWTD